MVKINIINKLENFKTDVKEKKQEIEYGDKALNYLKKYYPTLDYVLNNIIDFVEDEMVINIPNIIIKEYYGVDRAILRKLAIELAVIDKLRDKISGIEDRREEDKQIDIYNSLLISKDETNRISIRHLDPDGITSNTIRLSLNNVIDNRTWIKLFPYINSVNMDYNIPPSGIITTITNIDSPIVYQSIDGYVRRLNIIDNEHPIFTKIIKHNLDREVYNRLLEQGCVITYKLTPNFKIKNRNNRKEFIESIDKMLSKYNIMEDKKRDIRDKTISMYDNTLRSNINMQELYNTHLEIEIITLDELSSSKGVVSKIEPSILSLGIPTLPLEYTAELYNTNTLTPVIYTNSSDKYFIVIANEVLELPKVTLTTGDPYVIIPTYKSGKTIYQRIEESEFQDRGIFTNMNDAKEFYSKGVVERKEYQLQLKGLNIKERQLNMSELKQQIDLSKAYLNIMLQEKKLELEEKGLKAKVIDLTNRLNSIEVNNTLLNNINNTSNIGSSTLKNITSIIRDVMTIKSMLFV